MTTCAHRLRGWTCTLGLGVAVACAPAALAAQPERARGPWWTLWSAPSAEDRLIAGMVTTHVNSSREGWQNDRAMGLVLRGVFGATFVTTHDRRALTAGVERSWLSLGSGPHALVVGFRAGLMYGYDEQLGWLAGDVPVLPYAQPMVLARVGPLVIDAGYTWVVVSVTGSLSLRGAASTSHRPG